MQTAPAELAAHFDLRVQPMVHVEDLQAAIGFYQALGGRLVFPSRDGDWALLQFTGTTLSLLAHPPGDGRRETVELHFVTDTDLARIEAHIAGSDPARIARGTSDEMFGRMLQLQTPDGLLIKILQLERPLIA